jgi:hypothetical protein
MVFVLVLTALAACSPSADPALADKEASPAEEEMPAVAEAASDSATTSPGGTAMKKTCAGAEIHLLADAPLQGESEDAQRPISLKIVDSAGQQIPIVKPEEMKDYTAVGIGCTVAADGKPYFVAQYGELPMGCSFCEWYYLYDANGKQLTHSDPPILEDKSMPEAQRQSPNNAEYEALITKLGIRHPELDYIE